MVFQLPQRLLYPRLLLGNNCVAHQMDNDIMSRMTLQLHNALKATLMRVAALHPGGVLIYGIDNINQQTFCKLIKLEANIKKLLACTRIEIKGIGYHPDVEANLVTWLKGPHKSPKHGAILQWLALSTQLVKNITLPETCNYCI